MDGRIESTDRGTQLQAEVAQEGAWPEECMEEGKPVRSWDDACLSALTTWFKAKAVGTENQQSRLTQKI